MLRSFTFSKLRPDKLTLFNEVSLKNIPPISVIWLISRPLKLALPRLGMLANKPCKLVTFGERLIPLRSTVVVPVLLSAFRYISKMLRGILLVLVMFTLFIFPPTQSNILLVLVTLLKSKPLKSKLSRLLSPENMPPISVI